MVSDGLQSGADDGWRRPELKIIEREGPVVLPNDPLTDPRYSAWRELVAGSACTACHVTHWTGAIPNNSVLDPNLVEYYRSQDPLAGIIHSGLLYEAGQLGNAAMVAQNTIDRAVTLHAAIPDSIARTQRTTAVLTTKEGVILVGSSEPYIHPAQRTLLLADEIEVMGQPNKIIHWHAEQRLIMAAETSGLTPDTMFTSRPVCPMCEAWLNYFNIPWVNP